MHAYVVEKSWLTPGLVRIVLADGDLAHWGGNDATDAYVNLAFAPPGAPYGPVFDPAEVREQHHRTWWPARRRYTVRAWDPQTHRLTLDFVVHGDLGVAGPWAASAQPGSALVLEGPGGGYRPDPEADWLLMVGDESALPAIAASLEQVDPATRAVVRLLTDGPEHELPLACPGTLDLAWVYRRGDGRDEELLAEAVAGVEFPPGRVQAFVHGEATETRAVRRHLLGLRGLSRQEMSCSPYWRREMTDEAWREVKRDFVAAMDAEDPAEALPRR